MAQGIAIGTAVLFVRDLDPSVSFYCDVLALQVADRDDSSTAALLASADGTPLILRAMGDKAPHYSGAIGVQYVAWYMPSRQELDRAEHALRDRSAYKATRGSGDITAVEGRDPDGLIVVLAYLGPKQAPLTRLPTRVYAW